MEVAGGVSIKEWCESLARPSREDPWWALFWNLLWGIWIRRNAWVFNQKRIDVKEVIDRASRVSLEYKDAHESMSESLKGERGSKRWQHPRAGSFKVNSDAAVFDNGQIGCGGVVRDATGDVMVACCGRMEGGYEVDVAEALSARFVLKIAWESGFRDIVMESDCLKLIAHLKLAKVETSSFGNLVYDILVLVASFNSVSFNHVCRDGNKVAHNLAHLSRSFSETRVWLEEVPREVQAFVSADLIVVE